MKVLLDENLPHGLRHLLTGHEVSTVAYQGWTGTKNGVLLRMAAAAAFDVMLTMDSGVEFQQNNQALPMSIMILVAPSNDLDHLLPMVPRMLNALNTLTPRSIVKVH